MEYTVQASFPKENNVILQSKLYPMARKTNNENNNNIWVTGDLIRDFNIIKQPINLTGYRDNLSSTVMEIQAGGAWYLEDLIKAIHNIPKNKSLAVKYPGAKGSGKLNINQAFQVWVKCKEDHHDKEIETWRIENFLGCKKHQVNKKTDATILYNGNGKIDILVIDDVGLGFVDDKEIIKEFRIKAKKAKNIIIKTHTSQFNSLLWNELKNQELFEKTTVVTTIDVLREGGAYITRGYSWDKTIEEIAQEFDSGQYSTLFKDLKRVIVLFDKFGIASFSNEQERSKFRITVNKNTTSVKAEKIAFERFVYDTQNCEGAWDNKHKGCIYGSLSILTAAITLLYSDKKASISYILGLALNSIQKNIELGGGSDQDPDYTEINSYLTRVFSLVQKNKKIKSKKDKQDDEFAKSFKRFYSAYPQYHDSLNYGLKRTEDGFKSDILSDVAGHGEHYLYAKAVEIIMRGPGNALKQLPMARFGKYQTYDREEIERINSIHNLIRVYQSHPSDNRPLSFAVFGAPGSGKSFAIKQLLASIFGKLNEPLVFNLTQFKEIGDLYQALHIVRDRTVKGAMPLVFWDEFDSEGNKWLKEFLAPMQDGEFNEGSITHPIGRAIFIFAGGTCDTFDEYQMKVLPLKELKGPDFISRLRGYVNIKGPNKTSDNDEAYIIRRALLIYTYLKKYHAPVFEINTIPSISPGVVNALLKTEKYQHGARSMESVIALSRTGSNKHFDTSSLPSPELLVIHTDKNFSRLVQEGELDYSLVEILAEAIHNRWKEEKEKDGYKYDIVRNDGPGQKTHPRLKEYHKLKEEWKEDNRLTARSTKAKFAEIGYEIVTGNTKKSTEEIDTVINAHKDELSKSEHDIWLRSHLIDGYEYNETSNDSLFLHKDIASRKDLLSAESNLDDAIIEATQEKLKENNYRLKKI
jgi:hypothetical protein